MIKQAKSLSSLFFSFLMLLSTITYATKVSPIDGMISRLPSLEKEVRVDTLNEIAYLYGKKDPQKAIYYGQQALKLAQKLKYDTGQAYALTSISYGHKSQSNTTLALEFQEKSLLIRKRIGGLILASGYIALATTHTINRSYLIAHAFVDSAIDICHQVISLDSTNEKAQSYMAMCYNRRGSLYWNTQQFSLAVPAYEASIRIKEKLTNKSQLASSYNGLGILYVGQGLTEKAVEYYEKALAIYEETKDTLDIAALSHNLGQAHYRQGNFNQSIADFNKSLAIYERVGNIKLLGRSRNNLGGVYQAIGDFANARKVYEQALVNHEAANNVEGKAKTLYNIGTLVQLQLQIPEAIWYYEKSQLLASQLGDHQLMLQIAEKLTKVYTSQSNYPKALTFSEMRAALADSLQNDKTLTLNLLHSLEAERMKNGYRANLSLKDKKLSQTIIIGLAIVSGLLLLIIFAILRIYTDRQRIQLERQHVTEANHEVERILSTQAVNTLAARLEAQEEERKRVAKELHDRIGVMLSGVQLHFKAIDGKLTIMKDDTNNKFSEAAELLASAAKEVRLISHNMLSGVLEQYGLFQALTDLAAAINRTNAIEVKLYDFKLDQRLDSQIETNAYRIIQELVNNVLKHAKAEKIEISVNFFEKDHVLNVVVEDNGIGFDQEKIVWKEGIGLGNVQERVRVMNGKLVIDSKIGRGTAVIIDIPLPMAAKTDS